MQSIFNHGVGRGRLAAIALVAVSATACQVESQNEPELSGPSELTEIQACKDGKGSFCTITVSASPDRIPQDGTSQSLVRATVRDDRGQPSPNIDLRWTVTVSDGTVVEPSAQVSRTDAQGQATTLITAPRLPESLPTTPLRIRVEVEPVGADAQAVFNDPTIPRRSVVVELVPPGGVPPANRLPVPAFTFVPNIANVNQPVTFNASTTLDEGVACLNQCSYLWNLGDFSTDTGLVINHSYPVPGTYSVSLTVVDSRGGVASTARSVTVTGPAAPTALFVTSQVVVSGPVTFNATSSTVGAGATIDHYEWDFGDGAAAELTTALTTHTYGAPGTYVVTLKVTDSLGRESTRVVVVVVT